jgi:hypothetical protein
MRTSTVFKTNVVRRDVNVVTGKSRLVSYHDPQTRRHHANIGEPRDWDVRKSKTEKLRELNV